VLKRFLENGKTNDIEQIAGNQGVKVAILHPWFLMRGGGERVIEILADVYPEADLYTLFVNPEMVSLNLRQRIRPSILNAFPFSSRLHRELLPLYPWAVESLDLREYDVVISSCGPAMMGCSVRQDATHICYCHTPQRSYWDLYQEHQLQLPPMLRHLFVMAATWVRTWEFCAMQRVDHIISNSNYIADRVRKYFRRESVVIYPPVSMSTRPLAAATGNYYLTVGRLEKQKRVDILIQACNLLGRKLVIAGTGKEEGYLRSIAGPTVTFAGFVSDEDLQKLYAGCKAFLFAAVEDFGIAPVEAQAYGKPVIAYGHGGSLETVRVNDPDGRPDTGILFPSQTIDSLVVALRRFEQGELHFSAEAIQEHARLFDTATFTSEFCTFVTNARKNDASR
jgi:glycosyltransferase involved in cell wall biosynthesis